MLKMLIHYVIIKLTKFKPKIKHERTSDIMMTITRISKDNYKITVCGFTFTVIKRSFSDHWYVENAELHSHYLADSLSDALDYLDFLYG